MTHSKLIIALLALATTLTACQSKFDQKAYDDLIYETYPIGEVDATHDWQLIEDGTVSITANTTNTVTAVRILDANPLEGKAVVLAECAATNGEQVTLSFTVPQLTETLYAAAVHDNGSFTVVPFAKGQQTVDFSGATTTGYPTATNMTYPIYTYCYEADYPLPGDYDYNDVVMRVQKLPGDNAKEMLLRVTLCAVGREDVQMAGALHLVGLSNKDVMSVDIVKGKSLDTDLPVKRNIITNSNTSFAGRNGDVVISLFEDAHWAMLHNKQTIDNVNYVMRSCINVNTTSSTLRMVTITNTYRVTVADESHRVTVADESLLKNFTMSRLDPFIINQGHYEVHAFNHKTDYMIYEGKNVDKLVQSQTLSWAVVVPTGVFGWPIEGVHIGLRKNDVLSGAYRTLNHSFGEWVANKQTAPDWYLYPSSRAVYYQQ